MAILTIQRAPAIGVSGVQARGTDGGIGREWENLVNRYKRVGGNKGTVAQGEVLEVSLSKAWDEQNGQDRELIIIGSRSDIYERFPYSSTEGSTA